MQHVEVPCSEQMEKCSSVQGDFSLRIQLGECSSSSLDSRRSPPDCCTSSDETHFQSIKQLSRFEGVTSCTPKNIDRDEDAHRQISYVVEYHHAIGSSTPQGSMENTKQITKIGFSSFSEDPQSHGLSSFGGDGSRGREKSNSDATIVTIARTSSTISTDSYAECCRICQQQTEEPLVELGCECRGELAKAHCSCIGVWFNTKGSNKCEICQHIASNVPAPASQPIQHFWVWRMNGPYGGSDGSQRRQAGGRFHPLWAALLILIGGLLFDVLISIFLGASALPVNIIIVVLVVLGLGTAVRLVVECWHERNIRRTIQRMELDENFDQFQERPPVQISA